jgi:hypothetical protein
MDFQICLHFEILEYFIFEKLLGQEAQPCRGEG